jgi:hypothetical protein
MESEAAGHERSTAVLVLRPSHAGGGCQHLENHLPGVRLRRAGEPPLKQWQEEDLPSAALFTRMIAQ